MSDRDPYDILGVPRTVNDAEMKRVFKKLARQVHPDLNPDDPQAEAAFKEISAAYDLLSNPTSRKLYDEFGHEATRSGFDPEQARAYKQWQQRAAASQRFRGVGGDGSGNLGDLGDLFGGAFGQRARGWRDAPRRGADAQTRLTIDFLDAVSGATRELTLTDPSTGQADHIRVTIPAGIDDAQTIRLVGKGGPGVHGAPPGDLYITVLVHPHPVFRRQGDDITLDVPITVKEAVMGGPVTIPTPLGRVTLKVPPGSQAGQKMRLKGKGVKGGHLYAVLQIRVPTGNPEELGDALDALDAQYTGDVRRGLKEAP